MIRLKRFSESASYLQQVALTEENPIVNKIEDNYISLIDSGFELDQIAIYDRKFDSYQLHYQFNNTFDSFDGDIDELVESAYNNLKSAGKRIKCNEFNFFVYKGIKDLMYDSQYIKGGTYNNILNGGKLFREIPPNKKDNKEDYDKRMYVPFVGFTVFVKIFIYGYPEKS